MRPYTHLTSAELIVILEAQNAAIDEVTEHVREWGNASHALCVKVEALGKLERPTPEAP